MASRLYANRQMPESATSRARRGGRLRVSRSHVVAATRCRGAAVNPAALLSDQRASDAGWSRCGCGRGGGGDFEGFRAEVAPLALDISAGTVLVVTRFPAFQVCSGALHH